jgi:hypothetical protein
MDAERARRLEELYHSALEHEEGVSFVSGGPAPYVKLRPWKATL